MGGEGKWKEKEGKKRREGREGREDRASHTVQPPPWASQNLGPALHRITIFVQQIA